MMIPWLKDAYPTASSVAERALLRELLVHLPFSGELEHQVNAFLVVEEAIEPKDIWMPKGQESNSAIKSAQRRQTGGFAGSLFLDVLV